jgi:hypothetical protein
MKELQNNAVKLAKAVLENHIDIYHDSVNEEHPVTYSRKEYHLLDEVVKDKENILSKDKND